MLRRNVRIALLADVQFMSDETKFASHDRAKAVAARRGDRGIPALLSSAGAKLEAEISRVEYRPSASKPPINIELDVFWQAELLRQLTLPANSKWSRAGHRSGEDKRSDAICAVVPRRASRRRLKFELRPA